MRKNDCHIVRDLIPLVLDRAASDESRTLVQDHIEACEACRKQYDEMKSALPDAARDEYEREQQSFVGALKAVRRARLKRRAIAVALAAVICLAAAFGGLLLYDRLCWKQTVPVDNGLYSLSAARLSDGRVIITADPHGVDFSYSVWGEGHADQGMMSEYVYLATSPLHERGDGYYARKDCVMIMAPEELETVEAIRQGKPGNYVTVWTRGDEMPAASDEMNSYFDLTAQYEAWVDALPSTDDGKLSVDAGEDRVWRSRLDAARAAVPEWR